MVYILLLLFLFSIVFFLKSYVNKYAVFFLAMIWSLVGLLYTVMVYIAKTSNYLRSYGALYEYDYNMFLALVHWNIPYYTLLRISNWLIAVYVFSTFMFVLHYFENRYLKIVKKSAVKISLVCFLLALQIVFYDPSTSYFLYTALYRLHNPTLSHFLKMAIYSIDLLNYIWIIGFFCYIFYLISRVYRQNLLLHKRRQTIAVGFCLMVLNFVFLAGLIFGTFKQIYFFGDDLVLLNFSASWHISVTAYKVIPLVLLLALLTMVMIVLKYNVTHVISLLSQKHLQHNVKGMNRNLTNVFHSFKNVVFSFVVLIKRAQLETGERQTATLKEVEELMKDYIDKLSKMLEIDRNIDVDVDTCSIIEIMEEVIRYTDLYNDIEIERIYREAEVFVVVDSYLIKEAMTNIMKNAIEAIKQSKRKGHIALEIQTENEWVIVKIRDNGIGVRPKDKKHIFKNFYTTKSRMNNWGVGLSFVYKIIKMHKGYIYLESEYGVGTTFQVLLPRA